MSESGLRPVGDLVPGCRVTGAVASHQPWGMIIDLGDYEPVGASIDLICRRHHAGVQDLADDPLPVGTALQFVVGEVRHSAYEPALWIDLTAAG